MHKKLSALNMFSREILITYITYSFKRFYKYYLFSFSIYTVLISYIFLNIFCIQMKIKKIFLLLIYGFS